MTTAEIPLDELAERAAEARPGRAAVTALTAVLVALGWLAGRSLVVLGWLAGRTWLILAYAAEAVIFGFRSGAGLPPKAAPGPAAE